MFAGRYVWWLLTATTLFLISLFGFDGVAWFTLAISDCQRGATCYLLSTFLMGGVKPVLVAAAGLALTGCILARILWLRLSLLWLVPVIIWAFSVAAALREYLPLWHGNTVLMDLLRVLPPVAMAFVVLALVLCFPLEDEDEPTPGQAAPMGLIPGFAATVCTLHVIAMASTVPFFLDRVLHLGALAGVVRRFQAWMETFPLLAGGNTVPGLVMVMLFAIALSLRILRHERLTAG